MYETTYGKGEKMSIFPVKRKKRYKRRPVNPMTKILQAIDYPVKRSITTLNEAVASKDASGRFRLTDLQAFEINSIREDIEDIQAQFLEFKIGLAEK